MAVDSSGLALLSLHWHWVAKHLINNAPQLLSGHEQHKYVSFDTVLTTNPGSASSVPQIDLLNIVCEKQNVDKA